MDRKETRSSALKHSYTACFLIPLVALFDLFIVEAFNHKLFTEGPAALLSFIQNYPLAVAVNYFLVLLTLAPAFFLRRRVFWCTLLSALWVILGGVNGFIRINRMTPFTTADLTVLNTGLDTLPNYMSKKYIVLLAVLLVLFLALLVFLFIKGPKSESRLPVRLLAGILALGISIGGFFGCTKAAFAKNQLSDVFPNLAIAYDNYGFAYCFMETWLKKGIACPDNYSQETVEGIRQRIEDNTVEPKRTRTDVNVIFLQLESFIDPGEIKTLTLSEDAVPNWTAMKEKFSHGYLKVPVVGAGTANTECEILTGMNTQYFGPGEYPYKTCLLETPVESAAYDLKENGYGTHAIHNHRATFYTRHKVYANLGFDDFTSLEYMPQYPKTPKKWCKDAVLTDQIQRALDSTEDQPDFVFTVSVQGHGSYPTEPLLENPDITVESCRNEEEHYALEYYVNQVHEMDEFLGELTEMLSNRKEKTILVLYGDHLPSLELTDEDMASGTLFQTEYLIWDNFRQKKQEKDLYSYQVFPEVLGRLGITTGLMNQFHQFCREEPTYASDLHCIQYDILYGQNYLYNGGNPYTPTQMKMGVTPITLDHLYHDDENWYLWGENFTPYCKVTVGDEVLNTSYVTKNLLRINEDPGTENIEDFYISVVDKHKEVLSDTE